MFYICSLINSQVAELVDAKKDNIIEHTKLRYSITNMD
jgi:hypothetical protein